MAATDLHAQKAHAATRGLFVLPEPLPRAGQAATGTLIP